MNYLKVSNLNNLTLFLPTNMAMQTFLNHSGSNWTSISDNIALAKNHIAMPPTLGFGPLKTTKRLEMLSGGLYEVTVKNDLLNGLEVFIEAAKIVSWDIPSPYGLMHVIDKVLEPPLRQRLTNLKFLTLLTYTMITSNFIKVVEDLPQFTLLAPVDWALDTYDIDLLGNPKYLSSFVVTKVLTGPITKDMISDSSGLWTQLYNGSVMYDDNVISNILDDRIPVRNGVIVPITALPRINFRSCTTKPKLDGSRAECCPGYFGKTCLSCPGVKTGQKPCYNRGQCSDGRSGNGLCTCNNNYSGKSCEQCTNCPQAYNPCNVDNGGCHPLAKCTFSGGAVSCQCLFNWANDGDTCKSPCVTNNGGCHSKAHCSVSLMEGRSVMRCHCQPNYKMDDNTCQQVVDPCSVNRGGCSIHGRCSSSNTSIGNPVMECVCKQLFVGDGYRCIANVWNTLLDTPTATDFVQRVKSNKDSLKIMSLLASTSGNVTVFVSPPFVMEDPNNELDDEDKEYMTPQYHIVTSNVYLDEKIKDGTEFRTMTGAVIKIGRSVSAVASRNIGRYSVNSQSLVPDYYNIRCTNGVIHFVKGQLYVHDDKIKGHHSGYWTIGGLIIGIAVVVGLVMLYFYNEDSRCRRRQDVLTQYVRFVETNDAYERDPVVEALMFRRAPENRLV